MLQCLFSLLLITGTTLLAQGTPSVQGRGDDDGITEGSAASSLLMTGGDHYFRFADTAIDPLRSGNREGGDGITEGSATAPMPMIPVGSEEGHPPSGDAAEPSLQ